MRTPRLPAAIATRTWTGTTRAASGTGRAPVGVKFDGRQHDPAKERAKGDPDGHADHQQEPLLDRQPAQQLTVGQAKRPEQAELIGP